MAIPMFGESIQHAHNKGDRIIELLTDIHGELEQQNQDDTPERTHRLIQATNPVQVGADLTMDLGAPPPGCTWTITRLSIKGVGALAYEVYLDGTGGPLVEVCLTNAAGVFADSVSNNAYVREQRHVIVKAPATLTAFSVWAQVEQLSNLPAREAIAAGYDLA